MELKTKLAIVAILFIIGGFSILHAGKPVVENSGSILIGIGALYLIGLLLITDKNKEKQQEVD